MEILKTPGKEEEINSFCKAGPESQTSGQPSTFLLFAEHYGQQGHASGHVFYSRTLTEAEDVMADNKNAL